MHDSVEVGGVTDSSRIGIASDSRSKDVGVSGGKPSRHGGMVAMFSHMNMRRLLIEDRRRTLNGDLPNLLDQSMKKKKCHSTHPYVTLVATARQQ